MQTVNVMKVLPWYFKAGNEHRDLTPYMQIPVGNFERCKNYPCVNSSMDLNVLVFVLSMLLSVMLEAANL